eukprot:SAG31_NODE_39992_length_284_cov_0.713514_1_plen_23_part_10
MVEAAEPRWERELEQTAREARPA